MVIFNFSLCFISYFACQLNCRELCTAFGLLERCETRFTWSLSFNDSEFGNNFLRFARRPLVRCHVDVQ